jgi:hypothetical protein
MSDITRAPWLPPTINSRNAPLASGGLNGTAAAARMAGRIGVPVTVAFFASAGSWSSTPGNDVAIALTRVESSLLARPITALAS